MVKAAKKTVVVAMSGGVDSSVAAALLKESGHEVIGVTMKLVDLPPDICRREGLRSCCGRDAVQDAHRVALALGIPHYVADLRAPFATAVIEDFCGEYRRGRTPNPCIRCNRFVKFGLLIDRARAIGADFIATGHYARVERDRRRPLMLLRKGTHAAKDQSYFLYGMTQRELALVQMPVGGLSKTEVRRKARALGLPVADKSESQEICFVPDDDYPGFLKSRIPEAFEPGPIVGLDGKVLGRHPGIGHFTVGQRRGLGISAAGPLYVVAIDAASRTIVAGPDEALFAKSLIVTDAALVSGAALAAPFRARVKIRSRHREEPARVVPLGATEVRVEFDVPQRAAAPGQAAVFYSRDTVLGGGTIESVIRETGQPKKILAIS